jgi:TonB family protein
LITENTRAKLHFGESTLYVHRTTKTLLTQIPLDLNRSSALFLLVSFLFHSLFMMLVYLTPPESRHFNIDEYILEQRRMAIQLEEEEEESLEELGDIGDEDEAEEDDPGLEEEEEEDRRMALEGPDDQEPEMDEMQAREEALERGALSVLNQMTGPQNLFGGRPIGMDDVMAFGNATGTIIGNTQGGMGLASLGSGDGFGNSDGIGIGRISTAGRYGEDGDADLGRDLTRMRERVERDVEVSLGSPSVQGHLDREIIQRVIGRHRREIRDCYQRELQVSPDLEGRVVVNFVIDPAGNVADASIGESDLNNDDVESCMTRRVRHWVFPTPTTPGIVRVSYPFVFTSG